MLTKHNYEVLTWGSTRKCTKIQENNNSWTGQDRKGHPEGHLLLHLVTPFRQCWLILTTNGCCWASASFPWLPAHLPMNPNKTQSDFNCCCTLNVLVMSHNICITIANEFQLVLKLGAFPAFVSLRMWLPSPHPLPHHGDIKPWPYLGHVLHTSCSLLTPFLLFPPYVIHHHVHSLCTPITPDP